MSTKPRYETALVTGGSTGIGAALAAELAARGTRVAICARRPEQLDAMRPRIGPSGIVIAADLSDPKRAVEVVDEAAAKLGHLDLVVANAGMGIARSATKLREEHVTPVFMLNTVGACATLTAAIPHMLERKKGHLVGISSIAGYRGLPSNAAYSASKAAFSAFLESIRVDLYRTGLQVTDVRPGFIDTPLTQKNKFKMPFLMPADEGGRRILRALEAGRRVYTFPWPMAIGARILTLIPRWLYDRVASGTDIEKS